MLSEAEQLACQDHLEQGSKLARYIPTPLPPERRAFYDAVVREKAPPTASQVVQSAGSKQAARNVGLAGMIGSQGNATRALTGAQPAFGCKFSFGGPKGTNGWSKPPHSLQLGPLPCAFTPPVSGLTPEAGIRNPDTVVKGKD